MSVGSELSPFQNRTPTYRARMPSDKSTVATKADFVPTVVGETERGRSVSSVLAHDGTSPRPRPEVHETHPNVLGDGPSAYRAPPTSSSRFKLSGRQSATPQLPGRLRASTLSGAPHGAQRGPSSSRSSDRATATFGRARRRILQNSLRSGASRGHGADDGPYWARDMLRAALSATDSPTASARKSPKTANRLIGDAERLHADRDAPGAGVQRERNPRNIGGVQLEDSINISETPGTRMLWSKLREIAELQESDPSVALAMEPWL